MFAPELNQAVVAGREKRTAVGSEGELTADAFHTGSAATDDDHRVTYDPETGILWYDKNGDHDGGATRIVRLDKGLDLTHEHFEII